MTARTEDARAVLFVRIFLSTFRFFERWLEHGDLNSAADVRFRSCTPEVIKDAISAAFLFSVTVAFLSGGSSFSVHRNEIQKRNLLGEPA